MLGIRNRVMTTLCFNRKMVVIAFLGAFLCVGSIASKVNAAEIFTQETEYSPSETAVIEGVTFWANELVTLQVTQMDGAPLSGSGGLPWEESTSDLGDFTTYWAVEWEYAGDSLLVNAEGQQSGEMATTAFLCPSTGLNQLQNGTTSSPPEWANGSINSDNSCYSEGRSVPYRYFVKKLYAGTSHYFTIQMEWTKNSIHALDYLTDYDATEASGISSTGGPCGTISTAPPPGCSAPTTSFAFPDFLNMANYSGSIPSDFFTMVNPGFVLDDPRYLKAYNVTIDSLSKYSFGGTSSNRTLEVKVYFTVNITSSVGFFWGGHLAESSSDAWGAGNGSASVSGAPCHMRAKDLDGHSGGRDRSIQVGVICLPPNAGIVCDSSTVCDVGNFTYVCRDTASAANVWSWTVINGTIVGSSTLDTVVFTVNGGLGPGDSVYVLVESCDSTSGCPGDFCCANDSIAIPVIICNNPPVAICQDVTVDADANCQADASVDNGSYDPDGDPVTITENPPGPYTVGQTTVTLIITDDGGLADTCQGTVTVEDNTPPVVQCPADITVDNDPGQCSAVVTFTIDATDNCPGVSATANPASGSFFNVGLTTVEVIATDASGNKDTCYFNVMVNDTENPVAQCPADITVGNDPGQCGAVVAFSASVTDNCPGATISCNPPSGSYFQIGTTTVTCTATDASNNTSICTFYVAVNDTEDPIAQCPADITVGNDPGQCGAVVTFTATATDNCPGVTIDCDPASGSFFPVGTTVVTCTATDASSNTGICTFNVTVNDTEKPVAHCPGDITVNNDPGQCGAVVTFTATATDNCPGVTIDCDPASGSFFPVGTTVVTCIATDASGNKCTNICTFNITVNDTEDPVAQCPADITVGNDLGQCSAAVSFTVNATDNCPGVSVTANPASGTTFSVGATNVEVIATDASGNKDTCYFNVTVNDTEDPVAQCPADITVNNDPGQCGAVVTFTATATDNCPGATISCDPPSGSFFPVGTTVVTCTATDASSNTGICTFNVTVNDTEKPVAHCPGDITVDNDPGQCGAVVTFTATAIDNCPGVTIDCDPPSGSFFPVGTTVVTCTATDASGNKCTNVCTFNITVNDTEDPVAQCPADITVGNDAGQCSAAVSFTVNATDNCPGVSVTANPVSGSVFAVGTTPIEVIATDAVGNKDTCYFNVTVNDTENPVAQCPGDITVATEAGTCGATVTFSATATDNCPGVTISCNPPSGTFFSGGITVVTCTATDAANNTSDCTFNVTVTNSPPVASCPEDTTVTFPCTPGEICVGPFSASDPDNNIVSESVDLGTLSGGYVCFTPTNGGLYTITYTVTDACGEIGQCQTNITVQYSNQPPVATCPGNQTMLVCDLSPITISGFSCSDPDDNLTSCTVDNGTLVGDEVTFTPVEGVNTITLTATDACSAVDSCKTQITVVLNSPPEATCPGNQTIVVCDLSPVTISGFSCSDVDNNLTSCDVDNGTLSGDEVTFTPIEGLNTITLTATDECNETDICQTQITIVLNGPPQATCPTNQTLLVCDLSPVTIPGFSCSDPDDNLVSCNVDNGTLTGDEVTFTPIEGLNTITLTATDECNETDVCQTQITVVLNSPPQAACADDQTFFVCNLAPITISGFSCSDPDDNLVSCEVDNGTLSGDQVTFTPVEGINTITLTATDECSETDVCQTNITINLNNPPVCNLPDDGGYFVCDDTTFSFQVSATDTDYNLVGCTKVSGPGSFDGSTWTFTTSGTGVYSAEFECHDDCGATCGGTVSITVTYNQPPSVNCPGDTTIFLYDQVSIICLSGFSCEDPDGNLADCYIEGVNGYLDGNEVCFTPIEGVNTIRLIAVDDCNSGKGGTADTCVTNVNVQIIHIAQCPTIKIEKTHGTLQGHFKSVTITTENSMNGMGGFDFLIAYDATALTLMEVSRGQLLEDCDWEYFTYRFGDVGNCGDACPSGLVRIVAIAETFDGMNHPACFGPPDTDPHELARMTFLVTNDRTFEGQYVPIYFFWGDCSDNSISDVSGEYLYLDSAILDYLGNMIWDEEDDIQFPEDARIPFVGAPDSCITGYKVIPIRCIEFWNGGIDIIAADSIDDRGDINQNGVPNEIADAVMYTSYFIKGLEAFGAHVEASIAASEVNGDGVALSVADLVYIVRIITGDASPYLKPLPDSRFDITTIESTGGVVVEYNTNIRAGAALLVFHVEGTVGDPVPGNGAEGMELVYNFDGSELRVLIYNIGSNTIACGRNILVTIPVEGTASLVNAEASDYQGAVLPVSTKNIPGRFELSQNYPNPFNPVTTISLNLPVASEWTISIYNIAGQMIKEYTGYSEAGPVEVNWDATDAAGQNVASGIYLYKAKAGAFTATRKMLLMK